MSINRVKLEDVINEAKQSLESGGADRAIALCRHVFKFYPRCLEGSRVLGEAYTEKRLLDEADQLFVFVLSADPQDVLGYVDRGFIAYERGQVDEAIVYYERALELDPSIEQLREELLRLYRERYGSGRAKIRLTKIGLANARLRDGFYGQAIEEYNAVLRETPHRLDVEVGLMEAYWRNRDYPRAEKLASTLLETHPNLVKANLILWHIYGVRRNQDRAAPYLDKAHALDPLNLLAERLFEDALVSNDAMRYISMLGVPAIPAFDERAADSDDPLVPDWVNSGSDTDVKLGLRPEPPAPADQDAPDENLGFDMFALLADTEQHMTSQQEALAQEVERQDRQEALAGLDELRKAADAKDDSVFNFFEEVEASPAPNFATLAPGQVAPASTGAFDFDFGAADTGDLSLFEEVDGPGAGSNASPSDEKTLREMEGKPLTAPFRLDNLESNKDEPDYGSASFDLFKDDELPPAPFDLDAVEADKPGGQVPVFELFEDDELLPSVGLDDAATVPYRFSSEDAATQATSETLTFETVQRDDGPSLPLEPEKEPFPTPIPIPQPQVDTPPAHADEPDTQAEETFRPIPGFEPPGLPETDPMAEPATPLPMVSQAVGPQSARPEGNETPEAEGPVEMPPSDDSYLNFLLQDAAVLPSVAPSGVETVLTAAPEPGEASPSSAQLPQAFHRRDEQGPRPDFVPDSLVEPASSPFKRRDEQGPRPDFVQDAAPQTETQDPSADSFLASSGPTFDEAVVSAANLEPMTESTPGALPQQPQSYQEQENEAMPIKRGPEDDNEVFDWEREELPDYLRAFAMDEDEVARSGLAAPNPAITEVNTPPARIRPRDDTGAPGDLPDWLSSPGGSTRAFGARGEQIDLSGSTRPGGGSLPNWLDQTDLDSSGQLPGQPSTPPNAFGASDFGSLQPFSLSDDDGFGGPVPDPAPRSAQSQPPGQAQPQPMPPVNDFMNPARSNPTFSGLDDLQPFNMDDGMAGFTPPPPSSSQFQPTVPLRSPFGGGEPATPPARSAPPPPAKSGPVPFDLGLDMEGLQPFAFDDDTATTPPPTRQSPPPPLPRQTPPPAPRETRDYIPPMPQPSFVPSDDLGDLQPFAFDDEPAQAAPPPPARQTPPPAAPPRPLPPVAAPRSPFDPGADLSGFQEAELDALKPFSFDDEPSGPASAPGRATPASAQSPFEPPRLSGSQGNARGLTGGPSPFTPSSDDELGDIEPFSFDDGDLGNLLEEPRNSRVRGTTQLGLGAMNPLDSLSDQPFGPGRGRSRQPDPEPETETGTETPLREYDWIKRRKETQGKEPQLPDTGSLFDRLRRRRQEQDVERTRPVSSDPAQAGQKTDPEYGDILSFDEVEQQASRSGFTPVPAPSLPFSTNERDLRTGAFDLSTLGLNQDLDDEAFNQSLEETLPSSPSFQENVPQFRANEFETPQPNFDFEPFNLIDIGAEEAVQPTPSPRLQPEPPRRSPEPPTPTFDFNQSAQDSLKIELVQPFFNPPNPPPASPQPKPQNPAADLGQPRGNYEVPEQVSEPSLPQNTSDAIPDFRFEGAPADDDFSFLYEDRTSSPAEQTESVPLSSNAPALPDFNLEELARPDQPDFNFEDAARPAPANFSFEPPARPTLPDFSFEDGASSALPEVEPPAPVKPFFSRPTEAEPTTPPPSDAARPFDFAPTSETAQPAPAPFQFKPEPVVPPAPFDLSLEPLPPTPSAFLEGAYSPPVPEISRPASGPVNGSKSPTEPLREPVKPPPSSSVRPEPSNREENRSAQEARAEVSAPAPRSAPPTDGVAMAYDLYRQGDYNQSITGFNTAIKTGNNLDAIVAQLKEIVTNPAAPTRYHRVLGDAYKKQGLYQAALAEYSKALAPVGLRK